MRCFSLLIVLIASATLLYAQQEIVPNSAGSEIVVPLGGATRVEIELELSAGTLAISRGTTELVRGELMYGTADPKPRVWYELKEGVAKIKIEGRGAENQWDLRLNDTVPIELYIESNNTAIQLTATDLKMESLTIDANEGTTSVTALGDYAEWSDIAIHQRSGVIDLRLLGVFPNLTEIFIRGHESRVSCDLVGTFTLLDDGSIRTISGNIQGNFAGQWYGSNEIDVRSEMGHVNLLLPTSVAMLVYASSDQGQVAAINLDRIQVKDREAFANSAYQKSPVKLTLDVRTGKGNIALTAEGARGG